MADPIKSVRARQKNTGLSELDLKVSIYKSGIANNKRKVSVTDKLGNPINGKDPIDFPTNDRYSNYKDNDFIKDYLDTIVKLDPNKSTQPYEIIQDPWNDKFNEPRLFGFTPYYLNDGSFIRITWLKSGNRTSSKKDDADGSIEKKVELFPPESSGLTKWYVMSSSNVFVFSDDKIITEDEDFREYTGILKDIDILKIVIPIIKSQIEKKFGEKVSQNKLALCNPADKACSLIAFRNFLDDQPKVEKPKEEKDEAKIKTTDGSETNASGTKVKLTAKTPQGIDIIQNKDMPAIVIFAGKEVNPELDIYRQEDPLLEDEEALSDEFVEQEIFSANEVTDEPTGPNPEELESDRSASSTVSSSSATTTQSSDLPLSSDIPKSTPGPGPTGNSKLIYKSSYKGTTNYFLFNASNGLAGHRLKLILDDLAKYLNANGYPGTKLGNNGVMRDLVASTYPSSPARAVASLHGAGLALDVTFNIPGYQWKGIGDNGNLAKDAKLTKAIYNWVKGQGDITWGAQWGKGSNPEQGIVLDRGIVEYHHFEIRSDKISDYWKPFSSEISALGFDYTKLNTTGKNGQIYKLNLKLLASVGVVG